MGKEEDIAEGRLISSFVLFWVYFTILFYIMLLSIITINYNNKTGLEKTIESVLKQTFKDYEWIVIDGGSNDGSKDLIEKYSQKFTYWVSEKDKGVYNAQNKGILKSQGDYLLFLNSGDYLYDSSVLRDVFLSNNGYDILYGNVCVVSPRGGSRNDLSFHSDHLTTVDFLSGYAICHQASFIRRKCFELYGLYDESLRIVADWKHFYDCIVVHQCTVHYVNRIIVCYDNSGISSDPALVMEEREIAIKEFVPDYLRPDYDFYLHQNEINKYKYSRMLFSLLYRLTRIYEKIIFGL